MDPITAVLAGMQLGTGVVGLIGSIISMATADPEATEAYAFKNGDQILALLGQPSPAARVLAEERALTIEAVRAALAARAAQPGTPPPPPPPAPQPTATAPPVSPAPEATTPAAPPVAATPTVPTPP